MVQYPVLLPGIRCYVDAAATPYHLSTTSRKAGLGIFIVNPQVHPVQTFYIRAQMSQARSVLMAKAAAMALVATIADQLHYDNVNFLSDCQQLVAFLNSPDLTNPSEWQIKYFAQMYVNSTGARQARIFEISRDLNATADNLAKQAFTSIVPTSADLNLTCSNIAHASQCPLRDALQNVRINYVILLAATCC